jgi:predicted dehydrogenase
LLAPAYEWFIVLSLVPAKAESSETHGTKAGRAHERAEGMSGKLRVIQAGCGGMGQGWLKTLKACPDVELVGVTDLRKEAVEKAVREFDLTPEQGATDLKALLKSAKPQFVVDVTIPAAHKDVTLAGLAAGCHVLGEKPLADTMANAKKMVAAAKKAKKVYMVSQNRRWNPPVRAIRKAIASGMLGTLTTVNCDFYLGAHFGGFRDEMEHPLLLDMSIHHFDMMRCMSGTDPRGVYCHEFNPKGSWYKGDVASTAIFEMSGGVVFTYRGSWCSEGLHTSWEGTWRFVGDKGTLVWDGTNPPVAEVVTGTGGFHVPKEKRDVPTADEGPAGLEGSLRRFLEAVRAGNQPESWCGDNIKSLAMVFGAVSSAGKKKRQKIEI